MTNAQKFIAEVNRLAAEGQQVCVYIAPAKQGATPRAIAQVFTDRWTDVVSLSLYSATEQAIVRNFING